MPLTACTRHSEHLGDRQAGDGHPLVSGRVSPVLAMEVARSRRQTESASRNPPIDPRHEVVLNAPAVLDKIESLKTGITTAA